MKEKKLHQDDLNILELAWIYFKIYWTLLHYLYLLCVFVCGGAGAYTWECECVLEHIYCQARTELQNVCWIISLGQYHLLHYHPEQRFFTESEADYLGCATFLVGFRNPSFFMSTAGVAGTHRHSCLLMWVVRIQTHLLMISEEAPFPLSHLCKPIELLF